jgi:hypothetical protein
MTVQRSSVCGWLSRSRRKVYCTNCAPFTKDGYLTDAEPIAADHWAKSADVCCADCGAVVIPKAPADLVHIV